MHANPSASGRRNVLLKDNGEILSKRKELQWKWKTETVRIATNELEKLDQTIFITQSHSSLHPTCFTSSLEPASYITQNSSSKLFIPLSATFIWTCRFILLHTAITYHFFTVSLWAPNLPFQKILSFTLVCFCLSDWSHGSRPFNGFIC